MGRSDSPFSPVNVVASSSYLAHDSRVVFSNNCCTDSGVGGETIAPRPHYFFIQVQELGWLGISEPLTANLFPYILRCRCFEDQVSDTFQTSGSRRLLLGGRNWDNEMVSSMRSSGKGCHLSLHNCEFQLVVGGHGITYVLIIMILSADKRISRRREAEEEEGPLTDTYNEESS